MSVVSAIKDLFSSSQSREKPNEWTAGSYWCTECDARLPQADVSEADPVECPECGANMRFERSGPSHCAC